MFPFLLSLVRYGGDGGGVLLFSFVKVVLFGGHGKKETLGDPHYNRASWFGGRKGVYLWREKGCCFLLARGSGMLPLP